MEEMSQVMELVESGRRLRAEQGVKLRHPLALLSISLESKPKHFKELELLISQELNVKQVLWVEKKGEASLEYDFILTPQLKEEATARDLIRDIQTMRKEAKLPIHQQATVQLLDWPSVWQNEIEHKTNTHLKVGNQMKLEI
jgi:hypothetical protein